MGIGCTGLNVVRIAQQDALKANLLANLHARFLGTKRNLGGVRFAQVHLFNLD